MDEYERRGTLVERKYREYLIPTIMVTVSIVVIDVLSGVIVGNLLGEVALSVIGLLYPIIIFFDVILMLFGMGGVIIASIAKGQRETEHANRIFTLTFVAGIATMLAVVAVLLVFMGPITYALTRGDPVLLELTQSFLIPLMFVGPVMMLALGMALFARMDGNPRLPTYLVMVAVPVNIVLTVGFIRYMDMGMAGAGLALLLANVAGMLMLVPYIRSKQRTFRFIKLRASDVTHIPHIVRVGTPKALISIMSLLRIFALNALILATLGSLGLTTMTVCVSIITLTVAFITGTDDTQLPIVGTLYGEKDYSGMRFTVHTGMKFMLITCGVAMAMFLVIPGEVGRLFGIHSPEGLAMVELALRMYALSLPFYGANVLLQGFYQTTERVKLSSLIVVLNGFVFVTLFALLFAGLNANVIWLAFLFAEISTLFVVLGIGMYIHKKEGVSNILLLPKKTEERAVLDLSIPATVETVVALSGKVVDFCNENGTGGLGALRIGIAVEEMGVNIARYGHKKKIGEIDVLVRITEEDLILRLRDDGIPFDPMQYQPEEKNEFVTGGIEMVRRLSKDINYAQQLGFNVSIITIPRSSLKEKLLKKTEDRAYLDLSIPATVEAAVGLSMQVIDFCRENGTGELEAMRMGIAVEEMAVNIARYGHKDKEGEIDVLVRITEEDLILRLRDDGIPFDPMQYQPEEKNEFVTGGIEMVRRLSKGINYAHELGYNVSIITIPHTALQKN